MGNSFTARLWVANPMRTFHVLIAIIAAASYTVAGLSGYTWLIALGDVLAVFGIVHFFVHAHFHRQYCFLTDNLRTYKMPKKKMRRINGSFLLIFAVVLCCGMAVAREIYTGTLLEKLRLILNKIFGIFFSTQGLGKEDLIVQKGQSMLGTLGNIAPTKNGDFWDATVDSIQTIVMIVGVILLLTLCIVLIVGLIRRAIKTAGGSEKRTHWHETPDREETIVQGRKERKKRLDFSPNARVRRRYARCIHRNLKRGQAVPDYMTPSQIESMVALPPEDQYRFLHQIYEKARYSKSGCTAQEAEQAKSLHL